MHSTLSSRIGALCGVAFAVLAFLAVASLEAPKKATDQEIIDWWSKSSNQGTAVMSMFLMIGAAIAFGIFITSVRDRLNAAGSPLGNIAHAPGAAVSALMLVNAGIRGVVGMTAKTTDEPLPGVEILRLVPLLSRNTLDVACAALAVCALLTAWAALKGAEFPRWFGWASAVLGGLSLLLLPVVGPFVLPIELIWGITGSVALWRMAPARVAATRPVSPALA